MRGRNYLVFKSLAGEPDPFGEPPRGQPYAAELSLNRFADEADLVERVLERLDRSFIIDQQVTGRHCSGRRMRIDAVIRPRAFGQWKDPDVAFGIEFKLPDGSIKSYTRWLAQAVDYTHVDWNRYDRLIILTCPGVASWLDRDRRKPGDPDDVMEIRIAKRISGQLNVGELVLRWGYGLSILVNGDHIWSERSGVVKGRHSRLNVRSGSR